MRRRHGVDGDQIERGWAVDQHVGVLDLVGAAVQVGQRITQPGRRGHAHARSRARSRRDPWSTERYAGAGPHVSRMASRMWTSRVRHIVGRAVAALAVDAEAGRRIALWVEIDDQHTLADCRERGAEVDGGRRLATLVGEGEHSGIAGRSSWRLSVEASSKYAAIEVLTLGDATQEDDAGVRSVLLGTRSASIVQDLDAAVSSTSHLVLRKINRPAFSTADLHSRAVCRAAPGRCLHPTSKSCLLVR